MDLAALKDAQKALDARGNSDGFISHKDLTEEGLLMRLLPEPPVLNGLFYFPVIKYWMTVNGKRASFICPSTFGKRSPIAEELEEAKQSDDADVIALATDTDSKTGCVRSEEMWWACLVLKYSTDKDGNIEKVTIVDNRAKVFQCAKKTLVSDIIAKVTGAQATRKTKGAQDGAADRKLGLNMLLSKVGAKLATKYACVLDEQMEMPLKYYKHVPNVYEIAKAQQSTPSYQRAAVRLYLYGEEIPEEIQKKEDARKAAAKEVLKEEMGITAAKPAEEETEKPAKRKVVVSEDADDDDAPVVKKSAKKRQVEEDEEDETPVAKKSAKRKVVEDDEDEEEVPKKSAKKRVVEDDEEEEERPAKKTKKSVLEDDDDEDELPKKTATKKSKVFDDDEDDEDRPAPREKVKQVAKKKVVEDDEDEEEEKPKKKVAPAPGKGSRVPGDTGKKKSILDDIDDIDDDDLED